MRFFVRVVLGAVVLVTALVGQEVKTIKLGSSERPLKGPMQLTVTLQGDSGEFKIDTGKARGISFHAETGTAITCGRTEMAADKWYRINHSVSCNVTAEAGASMDLKLIDQTAQSIEQLQPKGEPGIVRIKAPDKNVNVSTTLLSFDAPGMPATAPKADAAHKPAIQSRGTDKPALKHASILPYITLTIALMALLAAGMSLFRRTSATPKKTGADDRGAAIEVDRFREFSADLTRLQTRIQDTGDRQRDLSSDISTRASQQDVAALQQMLDQRMNELQGALNDLQSSQNGTLKHLTANMAAVQSDLQRHSEALEQFRANASQNLAALLTALPQGYLASGAGEDTAKLLDRAVSDFFAQSVPPRDGLKPNKERTQALERAIGNLQDGIAPQFPDATERLKPLIDQARQLQSEIEDLLQITSTNRMRLRFEVEFYASKANREGLMSGIATGIKNQILKVEKPIEYFDRRFRALAAAAAQTASDFLDANVDLKRSDIRIQGLLQDVVSTASLEQIAPAPNDEFRASEHAVVQVMPRPGGAGSAPSVARLVSRGFRQGSQIVRKASVILYE